MASMSTKNIPGMVRWIPALVIMGIIFFASSRTASQIPFFGQYDVLYKKGGHAIGYALLGIAYFFALPPRLSSGYRFSIALLMVILFGLSDEFHQSFVEGRTSSMRDVVIDTAGAAFALLIAVIYSSNSSSNSAA